MTSILRERGYGPTHLQSVLEPGARHHETAWSRRLPDMLRFLLRVAG